MPRQVSGEWDRIWIGRSTGHPGLTLSYSVPTRPRNLDPFRTPVPRNSQASGLTTTKSAVVGLDSYRVPVSDDSGSGSGAPRQSLVTSASSLPYIGSAA